MLQNTVEPYNINLSPLVRLYRNNKAFLRIFKNYENKTYGKFRFVRER